MPIIRGLVADALKGSFLSREDPGFDRILIDAPCSGWGVIRRNPDLKWRIQPTDGPRLARDQINFLKNAAGWLKPGGTLVYTTCTLNEEENEGVVDRFLAEHPDFSIEAVQNSLPEEARALAGPRGFFQTWPPLNDTDGFFAARLRKQ